MNKDPKEPFSDPWWHELLVATTVRRVPIKEKQRKKGGSGQKSLCRTGKARRMQNMNVSNHQSDSRGARSPNRVLSVIFANPRDATHAACLIKKF